MRYLFGIIFIFVTVFGVSNARGQGFYDEKEMTLDQLSRLIFDPANHVKKVEDVVPLLPPALRASYVMVTDSKSLQEGTKENPRIVIFGRKANIFISFNGGKGRGNNTIEAIEHHREKNTYEFRRFYFSMDGSKPVTEERNPKVCAACHGVDSHPIWDPYPVWPSATPRSFLVNQFERKYIDTFIATGFNNPRYQGLLRQKNLDDMIKIKLETSMASQLDDLLAEERERRFVTKLKATPQFSSYRWVTVAALSDCPDLESYLPAAIVSKLNAGGMRRDLIAKTSKEIHDRAVAHDVLFEFTAANAEITGSLRWLFENRGVSLEDIGVSLQTPYLFTTTAETFYPPIIMKLSGDRAHFSLMLKMLTTSAGRRYLTAQDFADHKAYCGNLKQKSLAQTY